MKGIYKMNFNVGRREPPLQGVFLIDEKYVNYAVENKVKIHFGEVSGKHSDVVGYLEPHEITLITTDEKVVEIFREFNLESGFNPFKYPIAYWTDEINFGDEFIDLSLKEVIDIKLEKTSI